MLPWKTISEPHLLLSRPPWMTVWEEDVRLPSNHVIGGYLRAESRSYAMVFAVTADGRVPLVSQYKHGVGRSCYDLPAGYLDSEQESPLQAAQRELREETGLVAARWADLGHLLVDSNRGHTTAHLFLAIGAEPAAAQELDETEDLDVSFHTMDGVVAMVMAGAIDSMPSVAGILLGRQKLLSLGACSAGDPGGTAGSAGVGSDSV